MVCFRDSSATHASGHGTAPALESTSGFRRGSVVAGRSQCDSRWNSVGSALSAYLDKRNRFGEELGAGLILFAALQIWKIAPSIIVVIGAVLGGIFL